MGDSTKDKFPGTKESDAFLASGVVSLRSDHHARNDRTKNSAANVESQLRYHLNVQSELCKALEDIADRLPNDVNKVRCLSITRSIPAIIRRAHRFEEDILFPQLRQCCSESADFDKTLDRLHGEHLEDESFADEVHQELTSFLRDEASVNTDKLAYMLRGFFESLKRHVAFESDYILPMLVKGAAAK